MLFSVPVCKDGRTEENLRIRALTQLSFSLAVVGLELHAERYLEAAPTIKVSYVGIIIK